MQGSQTRPERPRLIAESRHTASRKVGNLARCKLSNPAATESAAAQNLTLCARSHLGQLQISAAPIRRSVAGCVSAYHLVNVRLVAII